MLSLSALTDGSPVVVTERSLQARAEREQCGVLTCATLYSPVFYIRGVVITCSLGGGILNTGTVRGNVGMIWRIISPLTACQT